MGSSGSKKKEQQEVRHRKKIAIVGLENSGKTTFTDRLKYGKTTETSPTIGFNLESITTNTLDLVCFDLAGGARSMWSHYLETANIVIYVVDSSEKKSLPLIIDTMHTVSSAIKNESVLVVILLNKVDVDNAMESDFFIKQTKIFDLFKND